MRTAANPYAEVGRAERRAQAIEEAFRAILRADFMVAERCLARAEREHYGMKPWRPGYPARDCLDQKIAFQDSGGWRYSIWTLDPKTKAHVRVALNPAGDGAAWQLRFWEAWGRDAVGAMAMATRFIEENKGLEPHQTSSLQVALDGIEYVVLRYEMRRPRLD